VSEIAEEEGEHSMDEGLDSASYSDAMSGVWSDLSDPEPIVTEEVSGDQKVGKRLAVTNLDWDNVNATDLYVLFSSFCHS
jgi:hypothetical protein